jgi:hypothetical protein
MVVEIGQLINMSNKKPTPKSTKLSIPYPKTVKNEKLLKVYLSKLKSE